MSKMKKVRMTIDILMVILLPLLMAYSLIGENIHEILGVCMFDVKAMAARFSKNINKTTRMILRILFIIISLYGAYAFVKRGIGDYLLMKVMFAFFDFSESRIVFLLDYIAIMVFVANVGFYSKRNK